jgi:hypothetical protein
MHPLIRASKNAAGPGWDGPPNPAGCASIPSPHTATIFMSTESDLFAVESFR